MPDLRNRRALLLGFIGLILTLLTACVTTPPPDPADEVFVPETTQVLSAVTRAALIEFAPDGTLTFEASAGLPDFEPNDVLVSEPSAAAPDGLLRKVVAVSDEGDTLVVETVQAKLEEAIYEGSASIDLTLTPADLRSATPHTAGVSIVEPALLSQSLSPQAEADFELELNNVVLFDQDGDDDTTDDQVKVDGGIRFAASFKIDVDFDWDGVLDVEVDFSIRAAIEEQAELAITGDLSAELDEEVALASYDFAPITVYVGIPLVFTPKLTLLLGANGEISASMSFEATQDATVAVGAAYDNGWTDLNDLSASFSGVDADFSGSLKLKGYAGIKFDIFLYGVVGPNGRLNAYLEMDGKIPRAPTWLLYGGLEAWVGVESISVLGLEEHESKVLDSRKEIARAGNSAPSIEVVSNTASERLLNQPVSLRARTDDPEDGPDCCSVVWTSNRDGVLGTADNFFHEVIHSFTSDGTRTITATVVDSDGASTSESFVLTIANSAPRVEITKPLSGTTVARGFPVLFNATSADANEPGGILSCDSLLWTSSVAGDPFPQTGCALEASFSTNGTRTLTLVGTDPQGLTDTATVEINVIDLPDNLPPIVRVTSPENGDETVLEAITLAGTATDPENDAPLSFEWTASLDGGAPLAVGNAASVTWTPSDTFDFGQGSLRLVIRLSVTDSEGNTGSDFVVIDTEIID